MSDITPVPQAPIDAGPATLSTQAILDLEKQCRENKAAELRGDPLPHLITPEMLRDAINSIRRQRGTMNLERAGAKKKGGASSIELIDLDGL